MNDNFKDKKKEKYEKFQTKNYNKLSEIQSGIK